MCGEKQKQEFGPVVEEYYERLFRGALAVTRDRHLAEEIVQETFVSAYRKFDTFSGRSSVFTWLYRIMLNNYCKHYRRSRLRKRLGLVRGEVNGEETRKAKSGDASPAAQAARFEEKELLMEAVDRLPVKLRVVIAMHYLDEQPLQEIAEILNCRMGTVKSRLFSARKKLCRALERKLGYVQESSVPKS